MPIIKHATRPLSGYGDKIRSRWLITKEDGASSLTVREVVMEPGSEGRLHTHPTEQVVMVLGGSIQMILEDEVQTLRRGYTLLAPPGVPHALINNTWVTARMLVIDAAQDLDTNFIE